MANQAYEHIFRVALETTGFDSFSNVTSKYTKGIEDIRNAINPLNDDLAQASKSADFWAERYKIAMAKTREAKSALGKATYYEKPSAEYQLDERRRIQDETKMRLQASKATMAQIQSAIASSSKATAGETPLGFASIPTITRYFKTIEVNGKEMKTATDVITSAFKMQDGTIQKATISLDAYTNKLLSINKLQGLSEAPTQTPQQQAYLNMLNQGAPTTSGTAIAGLTPENMKKNTDAVKELNQVVATFGLEMDKVNKVVAVSSQTNVINGESLKTITASVKMANGEFKDMQVVMKPINPKDLSQGFTVLHTSLKDTAQATQNSNKGFQIMGMSLDKLAMRAFATIIIWQAIRNALQFVGQVIGEVVQRYKDLDTGMRKVMAVTDATLGGQAKTYARLEQSVLRYYKTSIGSIKDITEVMYELGSAGRSTQEVMLGMPHIMNLSIGAYTDAKTAAKTVASIMNIYDEQLKKVGGTEMKIKYITDVLTNAWIKHQVEIGELAQAFSYVGNMGSLLDVKFEELVAASAVMSDALLKGGKGGRLLARAMVELGQETDKLRNIGVVFDPRKPLDFNYVMQTLVDTYKEQGKNVTMMTDLMKAFGVEGGRAIMTLITQWDNYKQEISKTKWEIDDTAKKLKMLREQDYASLIEIQKRMRTTGTDIGIGKSGLKEALAVDIAKMQEAEEAVKNITTLMERLGQQANLTKEEIRGLAEWLITQGKPRTAQNLLESSGINVSDFEKAKIYLDAFFQSITKNIPGFGILIREMYSVANANVMLKGSLEKVNFQETAFQYSGLADSFKKVREEEDKLNVSAAKLRGARVSEILLEWAKAGKGVGSITQDMALTIGELLDMKTEDMKEGSKQLVELIKAIEARLAELKQAGAAPIGGTPLSFKYTIQNLRDEAALSELRNQGLRESEILYADITTAITKFNRESAKGDIKPLTASIEELANLNTDQLYDIFSGLGEDAQKIYKQILDLQVARNKEQRSLNDLELQEIDLANKLVIIDQLATVSANQRLMMKKAELDANKERLGQYEYEKQLVAEITKANQENFQTIVGFSNSLRDAMSQGLADVMKGNQSFNTYLKNIGKNITDTTMDVMSEGVIDKIFNMTGMGMEYGSALYNIKEAISGGPVNQNPLAKAIETASRHGSKLYYDAITGASRASAMSMAAGAAGGTYTFGGGAAGGGGFPITLAGALGPQGFGYGGSTGGGIPSGWYQTGQPGKSGWAYTNQQTPMAGIGNAMGGLAVGALAGYSVYQNMSQSGGNKTAAVMGGLGAGMIGAGMMSGQYWLAGIGMLVGGIGWLLGMGGKPKTQTQTTIETSTREASVSSKIDVSNNKLELINRNLVALKAVMETYILPESAYFAEKRNRLEDQFSLNARRGLG